MTTQQILTSDDFSDRLYALRSEARQAGDREQVALCYQAIQGDEAARAACAEVLAEKEALAAE